MSLGWRRPETRADANPVHGLNTSPYPHPPHAPVHAYSAHAPPPIYVPHTISHLPIRRIHNTTRSPTVLTPLASPHTHEPWANCLAAGVPGPHMNMGRVCAGDAAGHCIYCRRRVFVKASPK
ncbi:hypothetical protein CspeluHIS016_0101460 [Cutaneotrichosporon spelunceum]|uniref:Uncharacterized protein n=1 Tax=Cutaneotrichosporon spelunceum TaxID=1672016 RepID=A0AAD3TNK4_9TREE|nr:hypothetical protein CspeluHIS016_0101460 [Cutaneotrichosporon spelunceum]